MKNSISIVMVAILMAGLLALGGIAVGKAPAKGGKAQLTIKAGNDRPGPVEIRVEGWDVKNQPIFHTTYTYAANDNSFSEQSAEIPKSTRTLRMTFINDKFTPGNPDLDRNAFIDSFMVNNVKYEAENFDRTGGTDPNFPGCAEAFVGGRTVADCGNENDFVEYDLHPGNPVGPDPGGPGKRKGPGKRPGAPPEAVANVLESDNTHLSAQVSFPDPILNTVEEGGQTFTHVEVPGLEQGTGVAGPDDVGRPLVKLYHRLFAVPIGAEASVHMRSFNASRLQGINLFPGQESPVDQGGDEDPPDERFEDKPFAILTSAYESDAFVPSELVSIQPVGQMRDVNVWQLTVASAQYNPVKDTLLLTSDLEFDISFTDGSGAPTTEESFFVTAQATNPFESTNNQALAEASLLNGAVIYAHVGPPFLKFKCIGTELVIISHEDFMSAANDLRDWKKDKGITTEVFKADNTTTTTMIQQLLRDRWNDCLVRPSYALLLGDAEFIPPFYLSTSEDSTTGTDLPYSLMTVSDLLADIGVARIPVDTAQQAQTVVDKIIGYERNPPFFPSTFYSRASFPAYFQCCLPSGADGTTSRAYIETVELIRNQMASQGYTVDRLYSSNTRYHDNPVSSNFYNTGSPLFRDPTPRFYRNGAALPAALGPGSGFAWNAATTDVVNAINAGRFLVIHRNHGSENGWVEPRFRTSDVSSLSNGSLLPVLFSVDCSTGLFDNETELPATGKYHGVTSSGVYLLEALLRKQGGGIVGALGDTRDSPTWANNALTRGFADAVFPGVVGTYGTSTSIRRLADIMNHGKLYMYTQVGVPQTAGSVSSGNANLNNIIWHAFGDPTQEIWTSRPSLLSRFVGVELFASHLVATYKDDGATLTAYQTTEHATISDALVVTPIGRGTVVGGRARIDFITEPDPDLPIELSASRLGAVGVKLERPLPDLVVDHTAPTVAAPGQDLDGLLTVKAVNLGNAVGPGTIDSAGNVKTGYVIDLVLSADTSMPGGFATLPTPGGIAFAEDGLLQGGRISRTPDVPAASSVLLSSAPPINSDIGGVIPTQTPPGKYFLCARIDPGDAVAESDETNNVTCVPIRINPGQPDLVVNHTAPTVVLPGQDIGGLLTVEAGNLGNALGPGTIDSAGNVKQGYMIDLVLSADESMPEGFASVPLPPGEAFAEDGLLQGGRISRTPDVPATSSVLLSSAPPINSDIRGVIPTQTPPGDYFLCARIDPGDVVSESDEGNNVTCVPVTVQGAIN